MSDYPNYAPGVKAYENADLTELAGIRYQSDQMRISPEMLKLSTAFQKLVVETERYTSFGPVSRDVPLIRMVDAVFDDLSLGRLIANAQRNQVRTWTHEPTGLPLRAKIDAIVQPQGNHLLALKLTDCTSQSEFVASCSDLDYDRQAAFYLSGVPDSRFFEFIGVQTQEPYNLFRVKYQGSDSFIETGRKKMEYLLHEALSESKREGGWIPSSWGRRLEEA